MRHSDSISEYPAHPVTPHEPGSKGGTHGVPEILFRKMMGIAAAAHELKTPLSILTGYTRLLLGGELGALNEQQRQVLNEMESEAGRLQRFINDFLAFGASESGRFAADRKPQDINAVVQELVNIWATRYEGAAKRLEFQPAAGLPEIPCDALKIQHVLSNLLDNALKYTPIGGVVKVSTRSYFWERRVQKPSHEPAAERRRYAQRPDNSVRVDVHDEGPGVAPEDHMDIFAEFMRSRSGPKVEGIGLGLAIAKRLIDAHRGKIWVESGPQLGTTFSFLLPTS